MPVKPVHNSQTTITSIGSFCICLLLWTATAFSQTLDSTTSSPPPAADRPTYQRQQRELVQQLRQLDGNLITRESLEDFQKIERQYKDAMSRGADTKRLQDVVKRGLRYEIFVFTDPDIQGDPRLLNVEFQKVRGRIGRAGSSVLNNDKKKRFRQFVCDEAIAAAAELLQNNFVARSLGCELLLDMEIVPGKAGQRLQLHDGAAKMLLDVLKDPAQPDAIKTRAANCSKKLLQKSNLFPQVQMGMASTLAAELRRPFTEVAYQDTLLATLEHITTPRQPVAPGKALHQEVAVQVMRDRGRDILVRCRAARVLGRSGFDSRTNFEPISWIVAELALEAGVRFNQPKANRSDLKWQRCGWYLYTAFHHEDRKDTRSGFTNRDPKSALVKGAYDNSVGIMAHLMFNNVDAVNARSFATLNAWLKANVPASAKFDPASDAIAIGPAAGQDG